MVIDDDYIEGEGCLLRQCGSNSVLYRPRPVAHGDNYASLDRECFFLRWQCFKCGRKIGTDSFQVSSTYLLHLYLDCLIAWIHVVEQRLAYCPSIYLFHGIEVLRYMYNGV